MSKVDSVEINPIVALDENNQVTTYDKAVAFDVVSEDNPDIVGWGVYLHFEDVVGVRNIFDVVDKENALKAQAHLERLYNLK